MPAESQSAATDPKPAPPRNTRLTIAEVAELLHVSPDTIRKWERHFPQIKPRRGPKGLRYYRQRDLQILRSVQLLLRVKGLNLEAVRDALSRDADSVKAVLAEAAAASQPARMPDIMDEAEAAPVTPPTAGALGYEAAGYIPVRRADMELICSELAALRLLMGHFRDQLGRAYEAPAEGAMTS